MEDSLENGTKEISQPQGPPKGQHIFNFLPPATITLLLIMLFVHVLRINEDKDGISYFVAYSAFNLERDYGDGSSFLGNVLFYWQFIGYQFLHAGGFHLAMNAAMMLQAGPIAEIGLIDKANPVNIRQLSQEKGFWVKRLKATIGFILVFLLSGALGALGFALLNRGQEYLLMGASGSISGIYAAFLWASFKMMPDKKRVLSLIGGAIVVFLGVNVIGAAMARNAGFVAIAWEAHLIGFIAGAVLYPIIWRLVRI